MPLSFEMSAMRWRRSSDVPAWRKRPAMVTREANLLDVHGTHSGNFHPFGTSDGSQCLIAGSAWSAPYVGTVVVPHGGTGPDGPSARGIATSDARRNRAC